MNDLRVKVSHSTQNGGNCSQPGDSVCRSHPCSKIVQKLMRAIALSVWLFLNLGFFGMCGYIYIIWAQNLRSSVRGVYNLTPKSTYNPNDPVVFYDVEKRAERTPRTTAVKIRRRTCDGDTCDAKLQALKNEVLLQMRRVLHDESSVFKTDNPYRVTYRGPRAPLAGHSRQDIRCRIKAAGLRTLTKFDSPFDRLPLGPLLGNGDVFQGQHFRSCAVVSNAASLLDSRSGPIIDAHEVVVRFNHAPTFGYEDDVGSKTDVRIVNSQVVTKPEFSFTTDAMYKNLTVIVWDPSDYTASLDQWFEKPDFDFFREWATYRDANPWSTSAVLDPRSVWRIWDVLQSLTALRIRRNPPSSGFLGVALMLPYCDYVDVFEYVPTIRMTTKCHYFDDIEDSSCTFGVWHPLAAEKFITLAMNEANDSTVFETGFARVPGFKHLDC